MVFAIFLWCLIAVEPAVDLAKLAEHLRAAATAIPDNYRVEFPRTYEQSRRAGHERVATAYLIALRAGHPVLLARSPQTNAITKYIVLATDRTTCEEWLRYSMETVSNEDSRRRTAEQLEGVTTMTRKDVAIAVWNLSSDPNLRLDAKNLWDTNELSYAAHYEIERAKAKQSTTHVFVSDAGPYRPTPMPAWQLPPNERCADRSLQNESSNP